MGRTSITGGVTATGQGRIQFTFRFEGATETDIQAITRAAAVSPRSSERAAIAQGTAMEPPPVDSRPLAPVLSPGIEASVKAAPSSPSVTEYATRHRQRRTKCSKRRAISGGERGIRTLEGLLTLTPLAGVRLRPLGHLSARVKTAARSSGCVLEQPPRSEQGGHDT